MHKILYFATIGLLAFSIGGCGDGGGGDTASPSPTPSAASPSPVAAVKPTPGTQAFPSPVVVAAQPVPGLIRSTNPEQRAKQTQTGIDDKKNQPKNTSPDQLIPPGPSTPNPAQIDPFGSLPPIAVQNPGGPGGLPGGPMTTNPFPKLPQRQVSLLPKRPESSPPPVIGAPVPGTETGPQINSPLGAKQVASRQGNPFGLGGSSAQLGSPRQVPGLNTPQIGRTSGDPSQGGGTAAQLGSPRQVPGLNAPQLSKASGDPSQGTGTGAQIGSPRQVPGINAPQLGRRPAIPPALQPIVATPLGVPNLPALPVDKRPPQWRDPNPIARRLNIPGRSAPLRAPQPIAARPLGVPNLPPLPVDKRPPQWIDPNPPPVKEAPAVPLPPSTDLATGTEVSGVVKVGSETQVIVKVPNEPTSRYVKVGQRLSNGRVLVKRVDVKSGADPIVILEENGVEVAKGVGEKAPGSDKKPTNAVISSLPNANRAMGR
jgi:hypothetical protein